MVLHRPVELAALIGQVLGTAAFVLKAAGFDFLSAKLPVASFLPAYGLLLPFRPIFHLTVI